MSERVRRGLRNPETVKRKVRINLVRPFTSHPPDTIQFFEQDWDILVVLDACRYDLLAEADSFNVPIEEVHSNASHTREFIKQNFVNTDCRDTVYVTASPQFADFNLSFAHIEHVWQDHWDEDLRTVRPEHVTEAAIDLGGEFPDKRLIIHYMQPHYPFIGPTGKKIDEQATFGPNRGSKYSSIWVQLAAGQVSEETVRTAYRENLDLVLPEIDQLRSELQGKLVLTSDHGNLYGKQVSWLPIRIHGHPPGIHDPELTAVPWVEFPYEERRKTTHADKAADSEQFEDVEGRLRDLGYR
ncbi:hypothetical protein SAMN05216226_1393 [Halovenus aranensis]|uniref:Sulfatase n=1 Tax=Halovenus aranensis TaxID=890420 RepID=A0A1G8ZYF3_9EURY|nr:LTA synthase family protein [Halovenus aranensis]SDK19365.1 hypothetical protein SAMN05216226_1393 [Halovenus aranensis]